MSSLWSITCNNCKRLSSSIVLLMTLLLITMSSCNPETGLDSAITPPESVSAALDDAVLDGADLEEFSLVQWSSVNTAESYLVYKQVDGGAYFPVSHLVEGTSFYDYNPMGSQFNYKIQSERSGEFSSLSVASNEVSCDPDKSTPPPKNVQLEWQVSKVKISWEAPDTKHSYQYQVYRKVGDSSWAKLGKKTYDTFLIDQEPVAHQILYYGVKTLYKKRYSQLVIAGPLTVTTYTAKPQVTSFAGVNTIKITAPVLDSTESYNLYRDPSDPFGPYTKLIYSGPVQDGLLMEDSDIISGQFYYYKLVLKNSSNQVTGESLYAFGVGHAEAQDKLEPNNSQGDATILNSGTNYANIYYYIDSYNNRLLDEDWYYLELPAEVTTTITFQGFENIDPQELVYLDLNDPGYPEGVRYPLAEGDSFKITNNNTITANIYFKVEVDLQQFEVNKLGAYQIVVP